MHPYAPRPIRFEGLARPVKGWTIKRYGIAYGDAPVDWSGFVPALSLAEAALPMPDVESGRPGLGFVIAHQGRTGDYLVLAWWDHENELPLRIWVRRDRAEAWRPAEHGESVCVWDLEVIWAERQAWVEAMMAPPGPDRHAYLSRVAGTTTAPVAAP